MKTMQVVILYVVIVHYFGLIPVDSYNGTFDELCDVNLDIPTNCNMCIKCCNATERDNISIPTYCSKCPRCNDGKLLLDCSKHKCEFRNIDHIVVIRDQFYLHKYREFCSSL